MMKKQFNYILSIVFSVGLFVSLVSPSLVFAQGYNTPYGPVYNTPSTYSQSSYYWQGSYYSQSSYAPSYSQASYYGQAAYAPSYSQSGYPGYSQTGYGVALNPPQCSVSGPTVVTQGQVGSYTANCTDREGNLTRIELFTSPTNPVSWWKWRECPGFGLTGSCSVSIAWDTSPGYYYLVVNAYDGSWQQCTGNPTCGGLCSGWGDCGPNDVLTIRVDPIYSQASYYGTPYSQSSYYASPYAQASYYATPSTGDTTAPNISLTAPAAGATVSGPIVLVAANATDNVAIEYVQFFLNGGFLGLSDTAPPYSVNWNTTLAPNGIHTLNALAVDTSGNSRTAGNRTVTVNNATYAQSAYPPADTTLPNVSITSPTTGTTVSGSRAINATATDNVGVVSVQFRIDGVNVGTADTTSPYSYTWNTATSTNGSHALTAVARDAAGNTRTSSTVTVTVSNATYSQVAYPPADTTLPSVSITAPTGGSTVSGSRAINATATDNVGVVSVQFRIDGVNVGTADTTSPYSYTWNTATSSNGSHALTAVARDAAGNTRTSSTVTVTVSNATYSQAIYPPADTTLPNVSITAPTTGSTVNGSRAINATATDNIAVASVQFRIDGANVGSPDTTSPYTYTWNTATSSNGSHALTAVATDTSGNTRTSSTVTVTVSNATYAQAPYAPDTTLPNVNITAPTTGATVGGTIGVSANASDNVAVQSVQFRVDGVNFGAADTTAPYSVSWNTTSLSNGTHTLTASCRDTSGNTRVSGPISVVISNPGPTPPPYSQASYYFQSSYYAQSSYISACPVPARPVDPPSAACTSPTTYDATWEWDAELDPNTGTWATQYQVQVDNNSAFANPLVEDTGFRPASQFGCAGGGVCRHTTTDLPSGVMHYSRTRAGGVCGNSPWSVTVSLVASSTNCASCSISVPDRQVSLGGTDTVLVSGITIDSEPGATIDNVTFVPDSPSVATMTSPDTSASYQSTITGVSLGTTNYTATATLDDAASTQCIDTAQIEVINPDPWWQVGYGDIGTNGDVISDIPASCVGSCQDQLVTSDASGNIGIPSIGGNVSTGAGNISTTDQAVEGSAYNSSIFYTFTSFDRKVSEIVSAPTISVNTITGADLLTGGVGSGGYLYHLYDGASLGNLTINGDAAIGSNRVVLVVRNADVTLNGRINVTDGTGFFMLLSEDDISVSGSLGGGVTPHLEGIFYAGNQFSTGGNGSGDTQLSLRGSVVSPSIVLSRNLTNNAVTPAEVFTYGADQFLLIPELMSDHRVTWREILP
jgi:Bacterial Ig domain